MSFFRGLFTKIVIKMSGVDGYDAPVLRKALRGGWQENSNSEAIVSTNYSLKDPRQIKASVDRSGKFDLGVLPALVPKPHANAADTSTVGDIGETTLPEITPSEITPSEITRYHPWCLGYLAPLAYLPQRQPPLEMMPTSRSPRSFNAGPSPHRFNPAGPSPHTTMELWEMTARTTGGTGRRATRGRHAGEQRAPGKHARPQLEGSVSSSMRSQLEGSASSRAYRASFRMPPLPRLGSRTAR